jgi:hypothetical protein
VNGETLNTINTAGKPQLSNPKPYRGTLLTRNPLPYDPTVALRLGMHGDPRGLGVFYERTLQGCLAHKKPYRDTSLI